MHACPWELLVIAGFMMVAVNVLDSLVSTMESMRAGTVYILNLASYHNQTFEMELSI